MYTAPSDNTLPKSLKPTEQTHTHTHTNPPIHTHTLMNDTQTLLHFCLQQKASASVFHEGEQPLVLFDNLFMGWKRERQHAAAVRWDDSDLVFGERERERGWSGGKQVSRGGGGERRKKTNNQRHNEVLLHKNTADVSFNSCRVTWPPSVVLLLC